MTFTEDIHGLATFYSCVDVLYPGDILVFGQYIQLSNSTFMMVLETSVLIKGVRKHKLYKFSNKMAPHIVYRSQSWFDNNCWWIKGPRDSLP